MKIDFTFPDLQHPNSDLTIFGLAQVLENKYQICETFIKHIEKEFVQRIKIMLNRNFTIKEIELQEWLKNEWRDYIISGKAGFTIASQKRGDPAFVDSSSYYLAMQPKFTFSPKEKKFVV